MDLALKPEHQAKHGILYRVLEAGFDGLLGGYERSLKVALRHRFITLMVMLCTIMITAYLYVIVPKGFFPQEDTGQIVGITEASQDISFPAMSQRQQALVDTLLKDPDIDSVASYIGPGGPTATLNQGRIFIMLKPKPGRKASADQIISRLKPQLARTRGKRPREGCAGKDRWRGFRSSPNLPHGGSQRECDGGLIRLRS